ncbi:MAG: hypothetical protein HY689_05680 [Chloroflexi bacterium]|nr:hypothetical protein [Chloroflexota bacterium]
MTIEKPQLAIRVPPELHERIHAFRYAKGFATEEEAIRYLIERGLNCEQGHTAPGPTDLIAVD